MESSPHPRVVVGVDQSLAGYAALRTAACTARGRHLLLFAVRAAPSFHPTEETYIEDAFAEALGGIPFDLDVRPATMSDNASVALARMASDPRDLIVVGNDGRGMVRAAWSGSVGRTLFKHACCQILVVPAPAMHRATRRSTRKLSGNRAEVWDRFETEAPELRGRPFQGT